MKVSLCIQRQGLGFQSLVDYSRKASKPKNLFQLKLNLRQRGNSRGVDIDLVAYTTCLNQYYFN